MPTGARHPAGFFISRYGKSCRGLQIGDGGARFQDLSGKPADGREIVQSITPIGQSLICSCAWWFVIYRTSQRGF
jgi:hypothetical protein